MALTRLIVTVTSENRIEEAVCRIEGEDFELSAQSSGSTQWSGEHRVDVVGLLRYSAAIRADSGAEWTFTIRKSDDEKPFVKHSSKVEDSTIIDTISDVVEMP